MTEFLIYQGKAAIALAVFYMFYRLLLSKETFHHFNRIVLLGTAALSLVLPLCVITFKEVVVVPAMRASSETFTGELAGTAAIVPEVSEPIWPVILCSLSALGALAVLVHVVFSIVGIRRMIRSGSRQALESGETLIITETDTAPFSWMKYIVISREDYESGYSQILTHEKAHIVLRHSWDILFVDMITALQWFNPAIWMLKADLRALHEFEADDAVLRSGAKIKEYQYLLIRKAVSKSGYSVANSFNHSTLKARITMMLNKKSSRMSAWKALYVIPLVGISLAATAETRVNYQYEDQTPDNTELVEKYSTPIDKDTKISFKEKNLKNGRVTVDEENEVVTMIYYGLDGKEGDELIQNREPRFQGGGMLEFQKWVRDHIKYPEGVTSEGRVDVSFTVSKDGGVTDVKILRGADAKLNEEAIRVVESSGNGWVPAIKDGKKISITMLIPIIFKK